MNSNLSNTCIFYFVEEPVQNPNLVEVTKPEISNVGLKCGDIVFCSNFEDFNSVYLSKCSKNYTIPLNDSMIIDSSNLKGN